MDIQKDCVPTVDDTLVQALRDRLEMECGDAVTLLETHISWVLLAAGSAYKLKKPVHFSFVDFSTPALRLHFCEEEVRLNRRLAGPLYLGVAKVCGSRTAPYFGDCADPVDHAVHMRRFPDGALLSEMTRAGTLQGVQLDGLARRLATFHRDAPTAAAASPWGRAGQIAGAAKQLFDDLRAQCSDRRIPPLLEDLEARLPTWRSAWQARRRAGAVRECHGDLHLDNLVWVDGEVVAFDCIEFDPALRWIDVMNDIAFATMDFKAHGRPDFALRLLDQYLQASGDYRGLKVLRPYEIYRAGVRALVSQLRASQASGPATESAVDYVGCAQRLQHEDGRGARLMITHGLSGSGKSTVAGQLVEAVGAIRVRADVERKRLFGLDALQDSAAQGIDIYTPAATRRTYRRLAGCAVQALQAGYPVIIDAAFLHRAERREFQQLAAELRVPFTILHCHADPDCLRQRVAGRRTTHTDASEADIDVLERQLSKVRPLEGDEHASTIEVDTRRPLEPQQLSARWLGVSV